MSWTKTGRGLDLACGPEFADPCPVSLLLPIFPQSPSPDVRPPCQGPHYSNAPLQRGTSGPPKTVPQASLP